MLEKDPNKRENSSDLKNQIKTMQNEMKICILKNFIFNFILYTLLILKNLIMSIMSKKIFLIFLLIYLLIYPDSNINLSESQNQINENLGKTESNNQIQNIKKSRSDPISNPLIEWLDGSTFKFMSHIYKVKSKGRFHNIREPWVWDAEIKSTDGGVFKGESRHYKSEKGAIKHAFNNFVKNLVELKIITSEQSYQLLVKF